MHNIVKLLNPYTVHFFYGMAFKHSRDITFHCGLILCTTPAGFSTFIDLVENS